jgi:hypothetical protein
MPRRAVEIRERQVETLGAVVLEPLEQIHGGPQGTATS